MVVERLTSLGHGNGLLGIHDQQVAATEVDAEVLLGDDRHVPGPGVLDRRAGLATIDAVAQAVLVILTITFDLRLDVCQLASSKRSVQLHGGLLYMRAGNLSSP